LIMLRPKRRPTNAMRTFFDMIVHPFGMDIANMDMVSITQIGIFRNRGEVESLIFQTFVWIT